MDILTIGEVLIDLTQTGKDARGIPQFAANPGGAPANLAVAASRLGAQTAFIGKVGADAFGRYLKEVLAENKVDVSGMAVDADHPTTMAVVSVDAAGERDFSFYRSANADVMLCKEDISDEALKAAKIVHFGSVSLTADPSRTATLDAAARAAGLHHEALLMVDIGDMREGIPQEDAPALLRAVAAASQRAAHGPGAHVAGIGVNLGCLYGTCPDDENMALLEALAARAGALLGHALHRVSLGGSIFWNWFARRHGHGPHLPPGCIMEFRMGDPLLLGRDMYRDEALLAGDFRQDIFRLSATVLEVTERDIRPPRQSVHNGRGLHADCPDLGKRLRALVDCGSLHTDVRGLSLARPDWRISDFSGNYAILDLSGCPQAPVPGEHVRFIPSYWAVARTCRMPHIRKTLIHDSLPGRALSGSRPASPQQETAPLSEVS